MAKKVFIHKTYVGGLEAPRNSMELPVETSLCSSDTRANAAYSYKSTRDWPKMNSYPTESSRKKLIGEDIPKGLINTRQSGPSVVARLMGMDMSSSLDAKSNYFNQMDFDSFPNHWSDNTNTKRPTRREHPQEAELQKFKKDFEAWQTARVRECSKVVDLSSIHSQWLTRENLHEEMSRSRKSSRKLTENWQTRNELKKNHTVKARFREEDELSHHRCRRELFPAERKETFDGSSAPSKIVILRPGIDRVGSGIESRTCSSSTSEERVSIEDFLEEVKERLKSELLGKIQKKENSSRTHETTQRVTKQARETNFLRSESTRSYRSEIQFNGPSSDTGRFLSERLRNALKSHNTSRYSDEAKMKTSRSFRAKPDEDLTCHGELYPVNLIRSLSAPVSRNSFGKLLMEDRHVLTGARIRRKHEATCKVAVDLRKQKNESVSSFKYSFTLRGKLFGHSIQSVEELHKYECNSIKDIMSGPTVVRNFTERHENCTEVPPSPASVCSSSYEELWKLVDHLSPPSTPDCAQLEDSRVTQVFPEIDSNLNELSNNCSSEKMIEESEIEEEELDDQDKAYIRDLLVASGLYDRSSTWDRLNSNPISNQVYEQVKERYRKTIITDERSRKDHKVLLDLLNETLPIVLGSPATVSRFRKKVNGDVPRGRKLLDRVWENIRAYVHPPTEKSYFLLDNMVARDLQSDPWSILMDDDDDDDLEKEVEYRIVRDMIDEIVATVS